MYKIDFSDALRSLRTGFINRIGALQRIFNTPYAELGKQAEEVARAFTYPSPIRWKSMVDSATGLRILKSEKDPEALERVRQIADELFK